MVSGAEDKCSRLEADDLSTAVHDGIDSFILTKETSTSKNSAKAVK
jgi:pyruvate kinase